MTKPKYRYTVQHVCSCCDEIFSCPLLCCIFSLLVGILTLFVYIQATSHLFLFAECLISSVCLDINASRRFYGVIQTLSITNKTTYVSGLDSLCNLTDDISKYYQLRNNNNHHKSSLIDKQLFPCSLSFLLDYLLCSKHFLLNESHSI